MIQGAVARLIAGLVALCLACWGGYTYRGYSDALRDASQAAEASVQGAIASTKRDSQAAQERSRMLTKTEPPVAALRGWQGGLKRKENTDGTHQDGAGCASDPWGSPEYLRVLGYAVRAGNQAVDPSRDVSGAVSGDAGP